MVQLASTRTRGISLAVVVSIGVLCSLLMTTPTLALALQERNTADLSNANEAFPMSDIADAWQEAQFEAVTGELHHQGHGHRLVKKSSLAHRGRVEQRKLVGQRKRALAKKSHHTDTASDDEPFLAKRQWTILPDITGRARMWAKNIALTAGTAIFEGGCWLATRLFNLNSWQSASCMTGVALASLATAFATNTRPVTGSNGWIRATTGEVDRIRAIFEDTSGPRRRSEPLSRDELATLLLSAVNDTTVLEATKGPSGLLDPRTGVPLSHATWLTAAVQPLLVANQHSNVTSLLWLDIIDEHINVNTWLPVLGEPLGSTSSHDLPNEMSVNGTAPDLEKRVCFDKTYQCPSRGCETQTWRTCGSGTVAGPTGHYFHQDVYGGEAAYYGLASTIGADGFEGLREAAQMLSDKKNSQQAWHTCVCFELDGEWVSTGSSQFTWDGGDYLGHDQCFNDGCGTW